MGNKSGKIIIAFFLFNIFFLLRNVFAGKPSLIFPFSDNEPWLLIRGYQTGTHINYDAPWQNDMYALDFSAAGCGPWDEPALAMANGTVEDIDDLPSEYNWEGLDWSEEWNQLTPKSQDEIKTWRNDNIRSPWQYGYTIIIDHGDGYKSRYAHLNSITVVEDQQIKQGDEIGRVGNTGNVVGTVCSDHPGTHIHVSLYHNGNAEIPEPMSGYDLTEDSWYGVFVTSGLKIDQPPPYKTGQTVTATFTVTNVDPQKISVEPITFYVLTISGRGPGGASDVQDFQFDQGTPTLNSNESYTYRGSLTLTKAGRHDFHAAFQIDSIWYTLPAVPGQNHKLSIDVNNQPSPPNSLKLK